MRDLETGSLWSHILGRCMKGKLKDEELPFVPGTVTTWAEWKAKYPNSTVLHLPRTSFEYERFAFAEPSNFVIGLKVGQTVKAYTYAYLLENPIVQDEVGGTPILLAFEPDSTRAFVYERNLDGQTLEFSDAYTDGQLVDRETGSHWDPWTGQAVTGTLAGKQINSQYGLISFRRSWALFYPDTEIVDLEVAAAEVDSDPVR